MDHQIVDIPTEEKNSNNGSFGNNGSKKTTVDFAQKEQTDSWINFNIHERLFMRVAKNAPTAALIQDMFAPFLTEDLDEYDLTISGELDDLVEGAFGEAHGETEFYYNDQGIHLLTTDVQIFKNEAGFHLNGPHELLVMALPLIDRIMVTKGAAMIHALTVDYRGNGICIPAWGGVGKTSTMAKLLKKDGFSFMGDDWAFLSQDGDLMGYAKPMTIKPYHRPIYPHLFNKRHKPLVPVSLSKPIARMTTIVHPYVSKYPQLASISRRWSPEHMMVTPYAAFPQANFSDLAPVAVSLFIERYQTSSSQAVFEEKDTNWMVSRMIGNFNSEMPRQSRVVMTALGAANIVPIEQAFEEKKKVLEKAIKDKPAYLLRVPKALPPDQASDMIVEHIYELIHTAGIE